MQITHYLYNAFLVEAADPGTAIDPRQNPWLFRLESLIAKAERATVTHIVINHGVPGHRWQSDRVAEVSATAIVSR